MVETKTGMPSREWYRYMTSFFAGQWTPVFTGTSGDPTVTYTEQQGEYFSTPNYVQINLRLVWSAFAGGGGEIRISIPFKPASTIGGGTVIKFEGVTFAGDVFGVVPITDEFKASLVKSTSGGGITAIQTSAFAAFGTLQLSMFYRTT